MCSNPYRVFGSSLDEAAAISDYAVSGAEPGMQDSELMAESIRFVALNGFGKNGIADTVARCLIDDDH